ncbi:uncharacterized protein GGS22DRAFT_189175 [Annulohypoxylon maeteangense]|uniref:uncharacterized protein n=1 Tax=Annulohypoxylon maeteangense TaxID=1927788 RepID=UPI002008CD46|nr:uncharacterized protein GGS22DRAFT_189175 [Annulohypoxylon maeteangense]KAI0884049.1 hypothetical protein GGS22DRAFT_189175 [Annulohypoxylon maeteangense]
MEPSYSYNILDIISLMTECEMVESNDDELISSYFELDQASAPSPNSPGGYSDAGTFDDNIPGFEPIRKRENEWSESECEQDLEENFSGGMGVYLWPWSSQVFYSKRRPMEEVYSGLGIYKHKSRKVEKYRGDILPSKHSGIDWKKELRQVYRST